MIAATAVVVTIGVTGLTLNMLIQLMTKEYRKYQTNVGVLLNVNNRNTHMSYYVMRQLSLADIFTCLVAIPFVLAMVNNASLQANTIFCKAGFFHGH